MCYKGEFTNREGWEEEMGQETPQEGSHGVRSIRSLDFFIYLMNIPVDLFNYF